MKYYKVSGGDLFAVSLVEDPAIDVNFIALSKDTAIIKLENEKRLLVGPALIPNKPIYRNVNGNEFYISFDAETIEKLAQDFLINDYQHNITVEHSNDIDDVVIVESWIKTSENDKSNDFGFNEPIGTWFISMKVNNDEIWQKIKDGTYKGFSIEAIVGLDEIITNNVTMDKTFVEKLKELIYEALGQNPSADEIINEVVKDVQEKQPIEFSAEDVAKLREDVANLTAEVERLKSERDELESKLTDITAERDQLMKEKEELSAENIKLSKQPSINPNKEVKSDNFKNYKAAVSFMMK